MLPCQVQEIVTAHLQLEVLDVIMDHFRADRAELVHRIFLVLWLYRDGSVINHEAEVVQCDTNHQDGDVVPDGARLQQIDGEVENVVVFTRIQLLRKDELVHLPHFWVQDGAVLIFDLGLVLAEV